MPKLTSGSRRDFLKLVGAALPSFFLNTQRQFSSKTPNIIWLMADDAGWSDFGCYGHPAIQTPNIDRLAKEGIRFTNAFVTSPQCSPSRSSTWTGKYAHTIGTEDLHEPLPPGEEMLPDQLRQKNYFSGNIGKLHLGKANRKRFDYIIGEIPDWRRFMNRRPKDRPFFLTLGFHHPHRPYQKNKRALQHDPADSIVPPYLPDTRKTRLDLVRYYDEISMLDAEIGKLLRYLTNQDLDRNTILVFWSDNGPPFPREKGFLYDPGIRTPLIIQWKGTLEPGVRHGLTSLLDLAPTLMDVVKIDKPEDMQGRSFLSQIQDQREPGREFVFSERNWHDIDDHIRSVRTARYKYIKNYYPFEPYALPWDVFRSPTYQDMRVMRDAGTLTREQMLIFRYPRPEEELFDLETDSNEFHNLAGDPAYENVLRSLRNRLNLWEQQTGDVSPQKRKRNRYNLKSGEPIETIRPD